MARAVNDTPPLGEKVPPDHFNDHEGLCCSLRLKDATSRAAGPRNTNPGRGTDLLDMGTEVALSVPAGEDQPDSRCTRKAAGAGPSWEENTLCLILSASKGEALEGPGSDQVRTLAECPRAGLCACVPTAAAVSLSRLGVPVTSSYLFICSLFVTASLWAAQNSLWNKATYLKNNKHGDAGGIPLFDR